MKEKRKIENYCNRLCKKIRDNELNEKDTKFVKDIIDNIDVQLKEHYEVLHLREWRYFTFKVDDIDLNSSITNIKT